MGINTIDNSEILGNTVPFIPPSPENTDTRVSDPNSLRGLGAEAITGSVEPFGVALAITLEASNKGRIKGQPEAATTTTDTSKTTGDKGGGNWDDYHTKSE